MKIPYKYKTRWYWVSGAWRRGFNIAFYRPKDWKIGYARMWWDGPNSAIFFGPIGIGWWSFGDLDIDECDVKTYWPPERDLRMPIQ